MDFTHVAKTEGDVLKFVFAGSIDEDAEFPALPPGQIREVEIDLNGVNAINSVGIREWLDWIRPVSEKMLIRLIRSPKALVFQFNMVEGFLPAKAVVSSFYVPFFCEGCDREENILFELGKQVSASGGNVKLNLDPSAVVCSECKKPMEMDVTESKYFQFLKRG